MLLTVGSAFRSVNIGPMMQHLVRKNPPGWAKDIVVPPLYLQPADRLFPLKVGDELFIDSIDHEIHEKMDLRFDVAIGESQIIEGGSLVETLQNMADIVSSILPSFEKCLV